MIPELPADCWLMRAFDYVRVRTMLPDWVAFWMLMSYCGAALQDSTYVAWAPKPIFPNLPLLLVMPSGRGKTGGMNVIRPLFDRCLPYQIPEDSTAESAIRMFASNGRSRYANSVCVWEVPELADVFGRKDYQQGMIARVTRLLDAPKDREVSRNTNNVQIRIQGHAVMSWISGTTLEWLEAHVEEAVSSGGFLPRLVCIYSTENPKWIPDPKRDEKLEQALNSELYTLLRGIGDRQPAILELGEDWLAVSKRAFDDLCEAGDSLAGPFIARRQENILRIYLILKTLTTSYDTLTTSEKCAKLLESNTVNLAEELVLRQNPLLKRVLAYVVRHENGVSFAAICRGIRGLTAYQLRRILEDLTQQGLITWFPTGYGETGIIKAKPDSSQYANREEIPNVLLEVSKPRIT